MQPHLKDPCVTVPHAHHIVHAFLCVYTQVIVAIKYGRPQTCAVFNILALPEVARYPPPYCLCLLESLTTFPACMVSFSSSWSLLSSHLPLSSQCTHTNTHTHTKCSTEAPCTCVCRTACVIAPLADLTCTDPPAFLPMHTHTHTHAHTQHGGTMHLCVCRECAKLIKIRQPCPIWWVSRSWGAYCFEAFLSMCVLKLKGLYLTLLLHTLERWDVAWLIHNSVLSWSMPEVSTLFCSFTGSLRTYRDQSGWKCAPQMQLSTVVAAQAYWLFAFCLQPSAGVKDHPSVQLA